MFCSKLAFSVKTNKLIVSDKVRNSENIFRTSGSGAEKVQNSCFLSENNKLI